MGTTINPLMNSGPDDEGFGPKFSKNTGRGMATDLAVLRESGSAVKFLKPKKAAKKFITEAQGKKNVGKKAKLKASAKPKNLRTKKKKLGAFGETYAAPAGNSPKGVRVAESMRESFRQKLKNFRRCVESNSGWEKAVTPVKKLKRDWHLSLLD